ncbi:MAG TPA: potassium-transporting ATPase subunit KdpA [Pseudonocardia sp.]|jgi:K+-transporting ATPase ATPase A chain|nr:potassium-transporting ATPase subunit KdpA [Pseudonocardia sp.]
MNWTAAAWLQAGLLVVALAVSYRPLGDYMAHIFTTEKHWRVERVLYRLMGVDPDADQQWPVYARSVLAISAVSVLFLYVFQRVQNHLVLSLGFGPVSPDQSFNTAASFVTNTNWQSYSGESTMGHLVQMAGLAVQNFVSATVGIVVVIALIRGFLRSRTDRIGNFWVDLTRGTLRLLLPIAFVFALVLVAGGLVQNFSAPHDVTTLAGAQQAITGGPVASQEAIKELGTNGGGFYNANSAHPFENANPFTNLVEIYLLLVISFALPRTFGKMLGDNRQGYAVVGVMATIWALSAGALSYFESATHGAAALVAGGAMEGKEVRFGPPASALFASSTTLTSTGAVNAAHDSLTPFGGGIALFDMMLGEIAPGGTGSGLYGILVLAIVTVFVAGLMVGRTPEYLKKKIQAREIKLASLYILTTPTLVLVGTALAIAMAGQRASIANPGAHGLSEVLYAFTSTGNNNGSAFAGLSVNTVWYNTVFGIVMLLSRFVPMMFVVGLAGSLARQKPIPASAGTLPTHRPLFMVMLFGVILIVVGLTYFPALALGPIAEGLS